LPTTALQARYCDQAVGVFAQADPLRSHHVLCIHSRSTEFRYTLGSTRPHFKPMGFTSPKGCPYGGSNAMRPGSRRGIRKLYRPDPFAATGKRAPLTATGGFAELIKKTENEMLAVTIAFEPAPHRIGDSIWIGLSGQRVGVVGTPQPADRFEQAESVDGVVAGSGPISITARVYGINPGEWMVTAKMLDQSPHERSRPKRPTKASTIEPVYLAAWSWRKWKLSKRTNTPVKTTWLLFITVPAVIPGFWTAMAGLGIGVGLAVQALVISSSNLKVGNVLGLSLVAIACGLIGAKVWFIVLRRRERRIDGWCIQGVLVGIGVAAAAGLAFRVPVGILLDASTPGLFFAMAIGRVGCFFGGCCAGRPTSSRWGLWSVLDQRIGMRRVPTQWIEALLAAGVGFIALFALLAHGPFGGAIFVAGVSAYTLIRQAILTLRGGPRKSGRVAQFTATAAGFVLVADLLVMALIPPLRIG